MRRQVSRLDYLTWDFLGHSVRYGEQGAYSLIRKRKQESMVYSWLWFKWQYLCGVERKKVSERKELMVNYHKEGNEIQLFSWFQLCFLPKFNNLSYVLEEGKKFS